MMIGVLVLSILLAFVSGRPSDDNIVNPKNVVTVPPNCPVGQQWVNGQCREVWLHDVSVSNVITVPPNCPPGQEYVNGQCREVWRRISAQDASENMIDPAQVPEAIVKNVIDVPSHCPIGYKPDALGVCREIFSKKVYLYNIVYGPTAYLNE